MSSRPELGIVSRYHFGLSSKNFIPYALSGLHFPIFDPLTSNVLESVIWAILSFQMLKAEFLERLGSLQEQQMTWWRRERLLGWAAWHGKSKWGKYPYRSLTFYRWALLPRRVWGTRVFPSSPSSRKLVPPPAITSPKASIILNQSRQPRNSC